MATVKQSLDKDLEKLVHVEAAARHTASGIVPHGIALVFLGLSAILAGLYAGFTPDAVLTVVAAILGGYMALNIGANDVANNVGPAVGSRALTMVGALIIAAIFEAAGALLAGGDVVDTISKGIIDPARVGDSELFVWAMMAALIASAVWVNIATLIGAPVSTTHAVVGGVLGAGVAAAGFDIVDWTTMSAIAASWVVSPLMGAAIAAAFLALIKIKVIYREDKIAAARRWVPFLIATMAGAFACYLAIKGLRRVWRPDTETVLMVTAAAFAFAWVAVHPVIRRQSEGMENRNQSLRALFRIPLVCAAALLSFAHGANDLANAVGPLAAIIHSAQAGDIVRTVAVPTWILLIGAFGISLGLFLYGPKLIRMVGAKITKMNPMRAYCVALSAAITVIIASWLGLPVSSTHIAVGAVFGVGFFREFFTKHSKRRRAMVSPRHAGDGGENGRLGPEELRHRKLVRRSHLMTIVAAWIITVPAAALLAAAVFGGLSLLR